MSTPLLSAKEFNDSLIAGIALGPRVYPGSCPSATPRPRDLDDALQRPVMADMHEPGAKADAGKVRPDLVISGFPRALQAISQIATFGADKYSDGGWQSVPDGIKRYKDAGMRHYLAHAAGEVNDPESGLPHLAHWAWNSLAVLELTLREKAQ